MIRSWRSSKSDGLDKNVTTPKETSSNDITAKSSSTPTTALTTPKTTEITEAANTVVIDEGRTCENESKPNKAGLFSRLYHHLVAFGRFVGPGSLIAVAYIDPGNYSTDISAGAAYQFQLLFVVLASNLFAILLQCLAVKLGTVTGLNLAEACRAFLPKWLNYFLYILAEAAIIATDIAEVIGTAIALNLLIPAIPPVAGCALSILDVFLILLFYRPSGPMTGLRVFEVFVTGLVLAVVICFSIQLSLIHHDTVNAAAKVFRGYLPSGVITKSNGLYQACGILGATVMPHSLYLGSGMVQSRLKVFDTEKGLLPPDDDGNDGGWEDKKTGMKLKFYIPSLAAVRHSLKYSYAELTLCLTTFALFVNSAILIVAGASLYQNPSAPSADIFGIHTLLSSSIGYSAGVIFALALLFSGVSAGVVCTIAGQMICEGAINWHMQPWLRRLVTRSIAITPSIIIAGAVGREGLNDALNGTQVVLSIVLPFVSAPLIWFTCRDKHMGTRSGPARLRVSKNASEEGDGDGDEETATANPTGAVVKMANSWFVAVSAVIIWLIIVILNIANLVFLGIQP
ncbi:natural resistance-associated macrophage protein [Xylariaceae sp. FL0255]|nr:natural resistance-associated macrophage protein [Xylariaceae sp. FL0255]